jgi:hypothetical protein
LSRQGQSGKHILALSFSGFDPTETLKFHKNAPLRQTISGGDIDLGQNGQAPDVQFRF